LTHTVYQTIGWKDRKWGNKRKGSGKEGEKEGDGQGRKWK